MHHFIFPSKDTYITNLNGLDNKNFGIDEILNVAAQSYNIVSVTKYQSSSVSSSAVFLENLVEFSGSVDGYFSGSTTNVIVSDTSNSTTIVYGSAVGYVNYSEISHSNFVTSDFTGDFTGSLYGYVTSATINGVTYTDELVSTLSNASGSVSHLSGSLSGSAITGEISGSVTGQLHNFSGSLNLVSGVLLGSVVGTYSYYNPKFVTTTKTSACRTLLKFDVSSISSSIYNGDIVDPKFVLRLNVLEQHELPFEYTIYAYPISQSWDMGDGRYCEAGSNLGASWNYRNVNGGALWHELNPKQIVGNYLIDETYKEDAFGNGGATWYYSVPNTFSAPTSSVSTPFFNVESSSPTFEQEYSSSLNSNLTSSFDDILSSSLASVISSSNFTQYNSDNAYDLVTSIADPTYQNTSSSIADYLSTINPTSSLACSSCSLYQSEYSSSTLFIEHLSSSIQTILHDSSSVKSYADSAATYYLQLSSSIHDAAPTTLNEVYAILNGWVASVDSLNSYATNVNNTYLGFSASLSSQMGTTDPYLIYVSQSMAPLLLTSSLNLFDAQFSSSATNSFSASLIHYLNEQIVTIETETSSSVSGSLVQSFTSHFYDSLFTGSSLIISQSYSYESSDIKMDITPIVKAWIAGCVPNEGIILLTSDELTVSSTTNGLLGFYSKETNTIYSPHIDVVWDDSTFLPGDLQPIDDTVPFVATVKNLKKEYKHNSIVKINVFARDKFPLKNFVKATQQSAHLTPKYLPETTYYSIKDTETEEVIIDFDEGTKLSCDSTGNYFMLDMTGLPQERYFKILIKTEMNGAVEVIDNNTYFKVVR